MFDDVEAQGVKRRTKYLIGAAAIVILIAIVAVDHFATEDRCLVNVVIAPTAGGAYVNYSDGKGHEIVRFTTKAVPCDCLPGSRGFWTMFHSCPKPAGIAPGWERLMKD